MDNIYDTTVIVGDSLRFTIGVSGVTGGVYDLTGCTLSMQVRKSYYPSTVYASYSLYVGTGNTFYQPEGFTGGISATGTGGYVTVTVGSNYTSLFPPYTPVFYDLQAQTLNPKGIETFLRGRIEVLPEVTRG